MVITRRVLFASRKAEHAHNVAGDACTRRRHRSRNGDTAEPARARLCNQDLTPSSCPRVRRADLVNASTPPFISTYQKTILGRRHPLPSPGKAQKESASLLKGLFFVFRLSASEWGRRRLPILYMIGNAGEAGVVSRMGEKRVERLSKKACLNRCEVFFCHFVSLVAW